MNRYLYSNDCLFGVLGISDYSFCCVIDAETEREALEWGHRVAGEYNDRYGLLPQGRRLDAGSLLENAGISEWNTEDNEHLPKHLYCRVGEMPEFEVMLRSKFPWE